MSRNSTMVATDLAPGFRFHPTDEELVCYYLKRKVAGRRLRVDAISELDLYKSEPWDLPGRSRIRSRDMEWYFFSPLDKKYANRSRTSRTTGKGYWKTTGKDRAVRRGARVVGMRKTLVFHLGKAPKGKRTYWVMHEYRLEDEELVKAGVSQVDYVLCRIFQKNGAGPQSGAQYGAPLVEEEWEEDDDASDKGDAAQGITKNFRDSEHESKVIDVEEDNITPLVNDGKNACKNIMDNDGSSSSLTWRDNTQDFINFDHEVTMPELFVDQDASGPGNVNMPEIQQNHELPGDGYLELNDFADILDANLFSTKDSLTCDVVERTTQNSTELLQEMMINDNDGKNACKNIMDKDGSSSSLTRRDNTLDFINFDHEVTMPELFVDQDTFSPGDVNLPEIHQNRELPGDGYLELNDFADILDADLFSTKDSLTCDVVERTTQNSTGLLQEMMIKDKNANSSEAIQMQIPPSVADIQLEDKFYPVTDNCLSYHEADDYMIYVDAPEILVHGSSTEVNEFIYPPISIPSQPDPVDELITYFDATEDDLLNCNLENVNSIISSEVDKGGMQLEQISHSGANTNTAKEDDFSYSKTIDTHVIPDDHSDDGWDTTFKKHLIGILGSVSSPPALAAEYPIKAGKSFDLSSGMLLPRPVHVSPTAIHVEVPSSARHWPVRKNEEAASCGYYRDDAIFSCLETLMSVENVKGCLESLMGGWFCPFSLSFVLLALSYNMGLFICSGVGS